MSSSSPLNPHPQDAAAGHNTHAGAGAVHKPAHPATHHDAHRPVLTSLQHAIELGYVPIRQLSGPVTGIWGDAQVLGKDGHFHALEVGHVLEKGEVVLTAQNGIVQIEGDRFGPDVMNRALSQADNSEIDINPAAGPNTGGAAGSLEEGLRVGRDYESVSPLALDQGPLANAATPPQQPTLDLVQTPPNANPDTETTPENSPITFDPRSNDTSTTTLTIIAIEGHPINVDTPVTLEHGVVSMNPDGSLTFTPNHDYVGTQTFTYTDQNASGTSSSTVTVDVTPSSTAHQPVAVPDSFSGNEDTTIAGSLAANDTPSLDGGNVWTLATDAAHGHVTVNADGTFSYVPATHYSGADSFTYTITDVDGSTSTTTVTLTVVPVPLAEPDHFTIDEDTPLSGSLAANDTPSADGGNVWTLTTGAAHGTVTVNGDGTFTYVPNVTYNGTDTFTYTITDSHGATSTATVTVDVTPIDFVPAANPDAFTTVEDTTISGSVRTNDSLSADGGNVWTLATDAAHGHVTLNADGTFSYAPALHYSGTDSFTYTITDADGSTSTTTVTLTVTPVPVAAPDHFSIDEDTPLSGSLATNDTPSADGGNVWTLTTGAAHGTVTVNADGTFTYVPNVTYNGTDTFTYTITDSHGTTSTATVTVDVAPIDFVPVAHPDTFTTAEDTTISDSVRTNDALSADGGNVWTLATGAAHGVVVMNADGTFTYTPAANYHGTDSFTYTLTDADGSASTTTVTLNVTPVNDAPVATDDTRGTDFEKPVTISVLGNDSDVDGDTLTVTTISGHVATVGTPIDVSSSTGTHEGTATLNPGGTITFTPAPGFTGDATFTYDISDGNGGTSTATVTVTVGADHAPVAAPDTTTTDFQTPVTVDVLHNDSDVDGDTLSVTTIAGHAATVGTPVDVSSSTGVHEGTATLDAGGTITFTPAPGYTGDATFTYGISDGNGGTSTATVTVTVGPDHAPVANPDSYEIDSNAAYTFDPRLNDTDVDPLDTTKTITTVNGEAIAVGTPVEITQTVDGATVVEGTVALNAQGTLTFTPAAGYDGDAKFTYTITDGHGGTSTSTVEIAAPHAANDSVTVDYNTPATFDVVGNDTKVNGATLGVSTIDGHPITAGGPAITVTSSSGTVEGTVALGTDGQLTFTPADGYTGAASFTYTATDEKGTTNTATVSLVVDTPPTANPDAYEISAGASLPSFDPTHNDTDINKLADGTGDKLSITQINGHAIAIGGSVEVTQTVGGVSVDQGKVTMNPDGTLSFTPAAGYNNDATFSYTVTDGHGGTSTSTVEISMPHAADDSVRVDYNTAATFDVVGNDIKVNGATLGVSTIDGHPITAGGPAITVTSSSGTVEGTVALGANGQLTFTPADGYTGAASFTYTATDEKGTTNTATVSLVVDTPPTANPDTYEISAGTSLPSFDPTHNDTDINKLADGSGDKLSITQINGHAIAIGGSVEITQTVGGVSVDQGKVTMNPDGTLSFTPAAGYNNDAAFSYTVTDNHGGTSVSTVDITALQAKDDSTATGYNTPVSIHVVDNDHLAHTGDTLTISSVDGHAVTVGDSVTIVSSSGKPEGTVTLAAGGNLSFTPAHDYTGSATFTYGVTDNNGVTSSATVTVTVAPGAAPVANGDSYVVAAQTALAFDPRSNDSVATGDSTTSLTITQINGTTIDATHPVTLTSSTGAAEGTVSMTSDGSLVITPAAGYNGPVEFSYTAADDSGHTTTANVDIATLTVAAAKSYDVYTDLQEVPSLATSTFMGSAFGNPNVSQLGEGSSLGAWHTDNADGKVEVGSVAVYEVNPLPGTNPDSASTGDDTTANDLVIELEKNPGDASNLYTTVSTVAGEVYKLDFDYAARLSNHSLQSSIIYVYWEGKLVETLNTADPTMSHYSLSLVATTTGDSKLEFVAADKDSYGGLLDDIHFRIDQNTYEQGYAVHIPAISASFASSTPSEPVHVSVSGIPEGSVLSDGTTSHTYTSTGDAVDISGWNLSTLTFTPKDGTTGEVTLHVTASTSESQPVSQDIVFNVVSVVETPGNDLLSGGTGVDVFKWHLGDQGTESHAAVDTITNFDTASAAHGGDVLDLRDLLVGETSTAVFTSSGDKLPGNLTNYLHFTYSGGDTIIHVSSAGDFNPAAYSAAKEDQTIILKGVDLGHTQTDAQIITELLSANKLLTNGH